MPATPLFVHSTNTTRIAASLGDIWEFNCQVCGYHARYIQDTRSGVSGFKILSVGDPHARHTSAPDGTSQIGEEAVDLVGADVASEEYDSDGDQTWLPPNLRAQVEAILRRLDFGNA